jgi:isopentenyl-diphosphate delta-isomerase
MLFFLGELSMCPKNPENQPSINQRKNEHLDICINNRFDIEMEISTGFEDISFVHQALPEVDFTEISLETTFLQKAFKYPLFLSPLTGGSKKGLKINKIIGEVAEELGIGFGVGSQRAAINNQELQESFTVSRRAAPTAFIAGNLGAIQLVNGFSISEVKKAIEMIKADALMFHLNPLQEIIQPEGDHNFKGVLKEIAKIGSEIEQPIIIREVGCGISREVANELAANNIGAIDIAGAGGTSWAKIEAIRAQRVRKKKSYRLGELFGNWGIPTVMSLLEVISIIKNTPTICSGGIRNGLQAAKALALGADLVGIGLPVLRELEKGGKKQLIDYLQQIIFELQTAMFLTGANRIEVLQEKPLLIKGKVKEWVTSRGLTIEGRQNLKM